MVATTSSNRFVRRLEHAAGQTATLRRARGPREPDLRLLLTAELHLLELLVAVYGERAEITRVAVTELAERAGCRAALTPDERHELEADDELVAARDVVLHTSSDRPPPPGQIPCHRHYRQVYAMPKLSAVAHLPAGWHFDLETSRQILPWAVRVDPALDAPIWRPFPRPRWA